MFLHRSVILFTGGGSVCHILGQTPPGQTPTGQTPPGQTPPCPVHAGIHTPLAQCMLGYTPSGSAQYMLGYRQQVGGTHLTGMHTCCVTSIGNNLEIISHKMNLNTNLDLSKAY